MDRRATTRRAIPTSCGPGNRSTTAGFAGRIRRGSRLLVIDLDQKHGKDGFTSLGYVLLEHDIKLPAGPVVRTPHGRHLVMLRPLRSPKIETAVAVWDGADIMAVEGQFILPGTNTRDGSYELIEGSYEHIPEAPIALLRAIHDRQAERGMLERKRQARKRRRLPLPFGDAPACLTRQESFRLFRNNVFRTFWNKGKTLGDTSASAYEYHLAKACFCVGLIVDQTVTVIKWWHGHHGTKLNERRLRKAIIPAAWKDVAEYVVGWQTRNKQRDTNSRITTEPRRESRRRGRPVSDRTRQVLAMAAARPDLGPAALARQLGIPADSVRQILRRAAPPWSGGHSHHRPPAG